MKNISNRRLGIIVLVALCVGWEVVGRVQIVEPSVYLPPLLDVLETLVGSVASGELLRHLWSTVYKSMAGLAIAAALGIPLGAIVGYSPRVHGATSLVIELLRHQPPIAIIPVAVLFLGIHDKMKIFVIAFGCLWPIVVNTTYGVQHLEHTLIDTGRAFRLPRRVFLWEIVVKGSLSHILAGTRVALSIALIITVAADMVIGNSGMGYLIIDAERSFRFSNMYSGLVALAILGWSLNKLFLVLVERPLLKWHRSQEPM